MAVKLFGEDDFSIRRHYALAGCGLLSALVGYLDYRALSFAGLVELSHPNVAHEVRVLAVCAAVLCVSSFVLYSLVHKLTARLSLLEFVFNAAVGALMFASFVAITTAMAALGVSFFR